MGDGDGATPLLLTVDVRVAAEAYRAFETWAGSDELKVFFEPNTMMAVDRPDRRGFFYDEEYFITVWVSHGSGTLVEILDRELAPTYPPLYVVKDANEEPEPERTLALVLDNGRPIDEVRHLIWPRE